jgi:hypothetical protein
VVASLVGRRGALATVVLALAALGGGCGADSSSDRATSSSNRARTETTATIRGCAPQCLPRNITQPGTVPKGTYKAAYFFAGLMTVDFDKGWAVGEDSTGEFSSAANKTPDLRVIFWEDVFPTRHRQGLTPVEGAPRTADGVVGWLRANRNLSVTAPSSGAIGAGLPATVVDVSVAAKADNDDPGCPAKPCANFLGFPQWGEPYGIAGGGVTRFYFSDVKYGGRAHLLVAAVEGLDKAHLEAGLPAAERLIESAKVPANPA